MRQKRIPVVEQFLRAVSTNTSLGDSGQGDAIWMSRPGLGSIFLNRVEAVSYSNVAKELAKKYVRSGTPSFDAIRRALNDAMFAVLDLQNGEAPSEEKIIAAVSALHNALSVKPRRHVCFVPVCGISPEGLPFRLGDARIVKMTRHQTRRVLRSANAAAPSESAGRRRARILSELERTDSWGGAAVVVEVEAHDFEAASQLARVRAADLVDVLNFLKDLVPYQLGWVYLPGEATSGRTGAILLSQDGALSVPFSAVGPLQGYSLAKLRQATQVRQCLRRIGRWLGDPARTDLASTLITAVRWAGRASVETRSEQAFLLNAIALETAALPDQATHELIYRLRVRVAHVLGRSPRSRRELSSNIKRLYDTRSKIVHSGSYSVDEADLGLINRLAKATLVELVTSRRFTRLRTVKDFSDWFESAALN